LKTATPSTIRLPESDRAALEAHFLALDGADRRLRFGSPVRDEVVRGYVARINFARDGLFAVQDDDLRLRRVVHVCVRRRVCRARPVGARRPCAAWAWAAPLFARAVTHLRNRGATEVFVHCLSENAAMMHLARKHGMRVIPAGTEPRRALRSTRPPPHSHYLEWLQDNQARAVQAVRHNLRLSRAMLGMLSPG